MARHEQVTEQTPLGTNIGGSISTAMTSEGLGRHDHNCLWEEVACAHTSEEPIAESLCAHSLLRACAAEARHLVAEAAALDATVAEALSNAARAGTDASYASLLTASLQGLDLLCQEIDGLGRILVLLADKALCEGIISADNFADAVKLGTQRRRLLVEGSLATDR